jgi:hypothetical protein
MSSADNVIPNKVFIGCPWRVVRPKFLKIVEKHEHSFPLYFVLIGRESDQSAEELLGLIKRNLLSSTAAIFDVTYGNPNVSLEYGIADASDIDKVLYLNVHKGNRTSSEDSSIIADLAGQKRKQYKNEQGLLRLLTDFAKEHSFTKRFENGLRKITKNMKTRHQKKRCRTLALKVFRFLDAKDSVRRSDLVAHLQALAYSSKDIERVLKGLQQTDLIYISAGRYATVHVS